MAYAEKPKDVGSTFKRILTYLGRQKGGLIAVLLLVAFSTGLELLAPYLTQIAIDNYIIPKRLGGLAVIALVLLLIYMTDAGVTLLSSFSMIDVAQRAVKSMRNDLFAKVQSLPIRFFDLRPHGELMSRFTNDIENIDNSINPSLVNLISSVLTIAGVTVVMLLINWRLAIVCLLSVPMFTLLTKWIARYTLQGFVDQQANLGILNGIIEENVTGQKAIKAFVHEQESISVFGAANLKLKQSAMRCPGVLRLPHADGQPAQQRHLRPGRGHRRLDDHQGPGHYRDDRQLRQLRQAVRQSSEPDRHPLQHRAIGAGRG